MRAHVRYAASERDGRRPPASAVMHLVEYVLRSAVMHRWHLADLGRCAARVDAMMFGEHSELIEMAQLSGFEFVEEDAAVEAVDVVPSTSDVHTQRTKSEVVYEQPDVPLYVTDERSPVVGATTGM